MINRVFFALLVTLLVTPDISASVIDFDVVGENNQAADDFYGIAFTSGLPSEFISTIRYTLPTGVFDGFNGVDSDTLSGLLATDISFNKPSTNVLEITFLSGTFGVGDSFRFGWDVDGLFGYNSNAEPFGTQEVLVEATLEGGALGSDNFSVVSPEPDAVSTAQITFGATNSVPEPTSFFMLSLLSSCLLIHRMFRKQWFN